jgi:hypothetical protein
MTWEVETTVEAKKYLGRQCRIHDDVVFGNYTGTLIGWSAHAWQFLLYSDRLEADHRGHGGTQLPLSVGKRKSNGVRGHYWVRPGWITLLPLITIRGNELHMEDCNASA